jgi:hypothetical protein
MLLKGKVGLLTCGSKTAKADIELQSDALDCSV